MVRVRLIRKLAARLNGVDVSKVKVGGVLELPRSQGMMLVQEGWAVVEVGDETDVSESGPGPDSDGVSA